MARSSIYKLLLETMNNCLFYSPVGMFFVNRRAKHKQPSFLIRQKKWLKIVQRIYHDVICLLYKHLNFNVDYIGKNASGDKKMMIWFGNDPEVESKYYRVPPCPFLSFHVNHKLRMTFFGICFILDISIKIIYLCEYCAVRNNQFIKVYLIPQSIASRQFEKI